jgi:hypothetical protein
MICRARGDARVARHFDQRDTTVVTGGTDADKVDFFAKPQLGAEISPTPARIGAVRRMEAMPRRIGSQQWAADSLGDCTDPWMRRSLSAKNRHQQTMSSRR